MGLTRAEADSASFAGGPAPGLLAPAWVWTGQQWAWDPAAWTWTGTRWVQTATLPRPRRRWTRDDVDGEPFHRLARNSAHRWWRPLVGCVVALVGAFAVIVPIVLVGMVAHLAITGAFPDSPEGRLFPDPRADLAVTLVMLGAMTPVALGTAWLVDRRRIGSVLSVVGRIRWRWLATCTGLAVGFVVVSLITSIGVGTVFDKSEETASFIGWGELLPSALIIVLLVPFQSAAEEVVFRGWLLQAIGSWNLQRPDGSFRNDVARKVGRVLATPWLAMVITSVVFVVAHGYTGWARVDIFCFAMVAAIVTVRTGGLEAAIALHVLNNLLAFLASAALGQLDESLEQGGAPAYTLLADVPPLVLYAAAVLWLARRRKLATVSPGGGRPRRDGVSLRRPGVERAGVA